MSKLNPNQKRLLFDYCFGLTTETDNAQVKNLITFNSEAANICTQIKAALAPLETLNPTTCPDSLVEKIVSICSSTHRFENTTSNPKT